jgi:hypothetical protein
VKKKLILIYCGILFLTASLFIGTPFEFLNPTVDRIMTLFAVVAIFILFIFLFRQTRHIDKKVIKWLTVGLITTLFLPYLWIGLWTTLISSTSYYPVWEDMAVYTNEKGEKITSQWRETSGSIYDYRNRKEFLDCGHFRISLDWSKKNMHGIWTEHRLKIYNVFGQTKDSTFTVDFDKKHLD